MTKQARLIVVGDIDGDYTWVADQLQEIGLQSDDRVFFLGNHVGLQGQSAEVLEDLIHIHPFRKTYHIAGNKDIMFRDYLMHGMENFAYPEILESYPEEVPYQHLKFLEIMQDAQSEELPQVTFVFTHNKPEHTDPNKIYVCASFSNRIEWLSKNILNVGRNVIVIDPSEYSTDFSNGDYEKNLRSFDVYS